MGPKAGVGAEEKRQISHLCQESNLDISIVQPVYSHFHVPSNTETHGLELKTMMQDEISTSNNLETFFISSSCNQS
jgi:hypothetical protein